MKKPRRERKVNTIKALKYEIAFYKRQTVPIKTVYQTSLKHIRLQTRLYYPYELVIMPKDKISDMITNRIAKTFTDNLASLPIEIIYDEDLNVHIAELDLWVKER